jgi:hypothetical protein
MPLVKVKGATDNPLESLKFAWGKIGAHLESQRVRVHGEISRYPMPIPACDAHFNHLLEERARIGDEIDRARTAANLSDTADDPVKNIEAFIQTSKCLDEKAKRELQLLVVRELSRV